MVRSAHDRSRDNGVCAVGARGSSGACAHTAPAAAAGQGRRGGGAGLPASPTHARIQARTYDFKEAGMAMPYEVYVPTKYDASKPTPLIIALHGLGSNPTQIIRYQ